MMSVPKARSGIGVAHTLDEREIALTRVGAPHRLQDSGRAGLERQVHLLADGRALGHRGDHRLAEVLRVRAREADPLDAVDGVAGAQQLAELRLHVGKQVAAPRVDVLAEQRQLLDAAVGEPLHLGEDLAGPPALLAAAHGRDDAVRALRVAAHRHLHPGLERALVVHRQLGGEPALVEPEAAARDADPTRAEPLAEVRDRARARTRRRRTDTARRSARAAPPRSSRRRRSRGPDPRACAQPRRPGTRRASDPASHGSCTC